MRTLKFFDKKLHGYLLEKDTLIKQGRRISAEIEKVEAEIADLDGKERKITESVNPKELVAEGNALQKQINDLLAKLETTARAIEDAKLAAIPEDMKKRHYALRDKKEKLERDRNKIALKVQKIKDRAVPIIRRLATPMLEDEYEDINTADVRGQQIVVTTFSHLEDWKEAYRKKQLK